MLANNTSSLHAYDGADALNATQPACCFKLYTSCWHKTMQLYVRLSRTYRRLRGAIVTGHTRHDVRWVCFTQQCKVAAASCVQSHSPATTTCKFTIRHTCNTSHVQNLWHTSWRSSVRDMTMRIGMWPPSLRVVSLGLSSLTVCPPTMTASDLALVSNTCCLDSEQLTHAEWPMFVAILPSIVIAYLKMPNGLCNAAL